MNVIRSIKAMLGLKPKALKPDPVRAEVCNAVQRNEMAGEKLRKTLEHIRMTDTLNDITGRM